MSDSKLPTAEQLNAMTDREYRALEARARRAAKRQGYELVKSRARSPIAPDYRGYVIVNPDTNMVEAGELNSCRALGLADVAAFLWGDETS